MTPRSPKLAAVVLAAGRSRRFGGTKAKVLQPLCGRPTLVHVLETLRDVHRQTRLGAVTIVVPPGKEIEKALAGARYPFPITYAVQRNPRGTGDAAQVGLRKVAAADEVLVLAADMPLVRASSLVRLVRERRDSHAAGALLTAVAPEPPPYGRIERNGGRITAIVEAKDATAEQLEIHEVNLCTYAFDRAVLDAALPRIGSVNAQGERYLTDVVAGLVADGQQVASVEGDLEEVFGTNTRAEFAAVSRIMRDRIVGDLMDAGVTVIDPDTTYVDSGVKVGADTVLRPNVYLEGATRIGSGCEIGPSVQLVDTTVADGATVTFAVAREARIGPDATVGPFASLRPGTVLARGAKAGTFAEMKNARIGEGAKVPHFSYMGDVTVGRGSNIAAGTITSNYDGKNKHATTIGEDVFIGSDSILVAPVRVGRGAYTGAGSVVTRDVGAGELVYGVPASPRTRRAKTRAKAGKADGIRPPPDVDVLRGQLAPGACRGSREASRRRSRRGRHPPLLERRDLRALPDLRPGR
jgi:bifunctional UDP-N-acetylglucosamine pyrophosphorylase/glucosamine-1-phosphate N-acetyltransferase